MNINKLLNEIDISDFFNDIPLVLPKVDIDGYNVKNWEFAIVTYNIGESPYLKCRYENPTNSKEYIFNSNSLSEIKEYLKEFNLINNKKTI
ncbi:MAG TPA: hypothetical protein DDY52_03350 [Candidatus Moranbacteria bacterium]|nr:hypothetical protein [Candidatus Moranbacteria bacterium]